MCAACAACNIFNLRRPSTGPLEALGLCFTLSVRLCVRTVEICGKKYDIYALLVNFL